MTRAGRLAAWTLLALLVAAPWGAAQRVEIDTGGDPDARLEVRRVPLPGGGAVELYVITGDPVTIRTGSREIQADQVEFEPEAGEVRVIGRGRVTSDEETFIGRDLRIDLEDERADGESVVIITDPIDVTGAQAQRVPGRVRVSQGAFSPCARCGQRVDDYGFRAERIELLPGDRLIAFDVTVLLRGAPTLQLPLLVLPLAEEARRPRLELRRAGADGRAHVRLDWPYVTGPNAFGAVTLRTWADVSPGQGGPVTGPLLGGRPDRWYLGGGIDHRFFDARGAGRLRVSYVPRFVEPEADEGRTRDEVVFEVRYQTDEAVADPQLDLRVIRDDAVRDRLVEARAVIGAQRRGVRARVESDVAIPLEPEVDVATTGREPLQTYARVELSPGEVDDLRLGALRLRDLRVDVGAFEGRTDPGNRSAATQRTLSALRVLEAHHLVLETVQPWPGFEVDGEVDFRGQYYDTGERLIDWDTRLEARQSLSEWGSFGVAYRREVAEGETPWRFDGVRTRARSDLQADLALTPAPWLRLDVEGGYVLRDSRRPDLEGWMPLATALTMFDDRSWIGLTVENALEFDPFDPGELEAALELRAPTEVLRAEADVRAVKDLDPSGDARSDPRDVSEVEAELTFGVAPVVTLDASGGYQVDPPDPDVDGGAWQPLEVGAQFGTLSNDDAWPGLRVAWERDLEAGETSAFGYELAFGTDPWNVEAEQSYDLPDGGAGRSRYGVERAGWARATLEGPALVPAGVWGLPAGEPEAVSWTARLEDAPREGDERWSVRWRATRDPDLEEGPGWRDSRLDASVGIDPAVFGEVRLGLDGFAELPLADAEQETSYLRRAGVTLALSAYGRVGLQGSLAYRGRLNTDGTDLSSARLVFEDLTLTTRPLEDLYLGARLDDAWELAADDPGDEPPFDLRPEVFFALDRCCWALYGTWNSADGEVTLTVGAPGADEGLQADFDSGLRLPAPEAAADEPASDREEAP